MNKSIKRCDDAYLENLLRTLGSVSEVCLPSILDALVKWYEDQINSRQRVTKLVNSLLNLVKPIIYFSENKERTEKALLTINYLFCIILIELLPQLHFHPTDCQQYVNYILNLSFREIAKADPLVLQVCETKCSVSL